MIIPSTSRGTTKVSSSLEFIWVTPINSLNKIGKHVETSFRKPSLVGRTFPKLSHKDKNLSANQIATSKLLHYLAVLPTPDHILDELQRKLVDFVWSNGRHWLDQRTMFQFSDKGGFGLTCLRARLSTFGFRTLQRFLDRSSHSAYNLFSPFLQQYRNLNLDIQLFLTDINATFLNSIPN